MTALPGDQRDAPSVTVLVPTYARPADLERCLDGLTAQLHGADQVVVAVRPDDDGSLAVVAAYRDSLPIEDVAVEHPGQIAALNAGLGAATGEIVAITDDDAVPRPHWLSVLVTHYVDPAVGAVGGRDVVGGAEPPPTARRSSVGRIRWFGRVVGNHHLGMGPPREVDVLKGANMSFRRNAIRSFGFDRQLIGTGAEKHNDRSASLAVGASGWKVIYDPDVQVDHYPAPRPEGGRRPSPSLAYEAAYNETLAVRVLPVHRLAACVAWGAAVGTPAAPGLLTAARRVRDDDGRAWFGLAARAWRARIDGLVVLTRHPDA